MSDFTSVNEVNVGIDFGKGVDSVGRLAIRERTIYFEYDRTFLLKELDLSPFFLPLQAELFQFDVNLFEGLPGVFNDSLPDGWGRLLFDRFLRSQGILPAEVTPLDRLSGVGLHRLGALIYKPDHSIQPKQESINLDGLAQDAQAVLEGESSDVLEQLIALNGSSVGARPKAMIAVDEERKNILYGVSDWVRGYAPWIVKFPNSQDGLDAGAIEYAYAMMAIDAGIAMPEVHLFPAEKGAGYFAVKRFDVDAIAGKRYHMHSACGLLHSNFREPILDYEDLIALTLRLTRDVREVEQMFRLAVFNVLAYNRDDHSKNFSFLMDSNGVWKMAPAYDLTFSSGINGEQSTMVMGEGRLPTTQHLLKLAEEASIKKERALEIINATQMSVSQWPKLAKELGVSKNNIRLISEKIKSLSVA